MKPFFYLDTHAGTGRYDLSHPWAQKNKEYHDGVARVWTRSDAPPALVPYLDAVRAENPDGKLRRYPGSPRIARRLLRTHDRMVLTELNRTDCAALAALFAADTQVTVQLADATRRSRLPPPKSGAGSSSGSSFDGTGSRAAETRIRAAHPQARPSSTRSGSVKEPPASARSRQCSRNGHRQDPATRAFGVRRGMEGRHAGLRHAGGEPAVRVRKHRPRDRRMAMAGAVAGRQRRTARPVAGARVELTSSMASFLAAFGDAVQA